MPPMFIAALFIIAMELWNQPKCPRIVEWTKTMWYRTSLVVQWLRHHTSISGGMGLILGWGLISHSLHGMAPERRYGIDEQWPINQS